MTACPHCQQNTFGGLRKILIGPGRIIACSNCENDVGVNRLKAWLALLPLLLAVIFGRALGSTALQVAFNVAASFLGILLYIYWVPLEKR